MKIPATTIAIWPETKIRIENRMPDAITTCVVPPGRFVWGMHRPVYQVANLRQNEFRAILGHTDLGAPVDNQANFPENDLSLSQTDMVYEIRNPFPFRGATYITKHHADYFARHPHQINIPPKTPLCLGDFLGKWDPALADNPQRRRAIITALPEPLKMTLAASGSDPQELAYLAEDCAVFEHDPQSGQANGLVYTQTLKGRLQPEIKNKILFETLANNPYLPDHYKAIMALVPGAQGASPIVGDVNNLADQSHVVEYLRQNSYIPGGHYAANMAHDSIRYRAEDLTPADMAAMRHLYYQRTYLRLAQEVGLPEADRRRPFSPDELERLRVNIQKRLASPKRPPLTFNGSLWGWNYGFDISPGHYRLHASHQQVHQQYALVSHWADVDPVAGAGGGHTAAFACGDLVADFTARFYDQTGYRFFECLQKAIYHNRRVDGNDQGPQSLVVYEDQNVILFVPKAQTSHWELQLMPLTPAGNILETDQKVRCSLDYAMHLAVKTLAGMGARMITCIEYAKRFDADHADHLDQRLLYCFLPRLPQSPGAFSEAQLRWINRHYPEDFAHACRTRLSGINASA